jgi:hypothetical protein
MTDAYGNFIISLEGNYANKNSPKRGRVKCTYSIKQSKIYLPTEESCVPFMTKIADFLQCKLNYKLDNTITFLAQSDSKYFLIKSYFNKYPRMTSKYLNYLCFINALYYLGRRLTNKEII